VRPLWRDTEASIQIPLPSENAFFSPHFDNHGMRLQRLSTSPRHYPAFAAYKKFKALTEKWIARAWS
jgi:hypothetical protein